MPKLPSPLLIALLAAACQQPKSADAPSVAPPAPLSPQADALPVDKGVALEAYDPPEGFKAAWDAAVQGGSVKAMCEVWLGGAGAGSCFEDAAAKRASFADAHAIAFIAERYYTEREGGMGGHMDAIMIVERQGRLYTDILASAHNGGVGYAGGDVEITSLTVEEVADGGAPELVVGVETSTWDGDISANTREIHDVGEVGVLQLQRGGPRWRMFAPIATRDGEEIMMEGEEPTPTLKAPEERAARLVWRPDSAEVEPQRVEGKEPLYPPATISVDAMPQRERE